MMDIISFHNVFESNGTYALCNPMRIALLLIAHILPHGKKALNITRCVWNAQLMFG